MFKLEIPRILWELSCLTSLETRVKIYPSKHLLVLKTSWRRLQDMSWRSLQHVFSVTILRLPRRLEDVFKTSARRLQDVFKTSWKTKNCYVEDVFKTSWRHVLKKSWRHNLRRFQDVSEANKVFTGDICI